jgi:iron transport multicopper oxidase
LNYNVTGWLLYSSSNTNPDPQTVNSLDAFDDSTLVSYDNQTLLGEPGQTVTLDVIMDNLSDGAN